MCEAVSNYAGNGLFYFFFDLDFHSSIRVLEKSEILALAFMHSPHEHVLSKTKHGLQFMCLEPRTLAETFEIFENWKKQFDNTDYFWSVPLWLRVSPKWTESGEEVSPAPIPIYGRPKYFKVHKLYRTND